MVFEQLDEGIYFIQAEKSNEYDLITPMIVVLPSWDETEGKMSYEIKVSPKHVPIERSERICTADRTENRSMEMGYSRNRFYHSRNYCSC